MTTPPRPYVEPTAASSPEARRRFVSLIALFLAGPTIAMAHFMAVYLAAEVMCEAEVGSELLGVPALSAVTVAATVVAAAAIAVATVLARRRWRRTGVGWGASSSDPSPGPLVGPEHDVELAVGGVLLGVFSIAVVLFVGLPALVLDPCLP